MDDRRSNWPAALLLSAFLMPALYLFGVGPLTWALERLGVSPSSALGHVIQTALVPASWVHSNFEWYQDYIAWWAA